MTIFIFGDSITYGAWDKEGGWAQRLRKFFSEKDLKDGDSVYVYNMGVPGDNTDDLLRRFRFETEGRIDKGENVIFVFAIGINDSQFSKEKNDNRVLLEQFNNNIRSLMISAGEISSKIIFVGLTPVDEQKTTPIPWNTNAFYRNEYIEKYDEILKNICKERNVLFVDIMGLFNGSDYKNLFKDGLHPNSAGHQKIFEIIKDFLVNNKII